MQQFNKSPKIKYSNAAGNTVKHFPRNGPEVWIICRFPGSRICRPARYHPRHPDGASADITRKYRGIVPASKRGIISTVTDYN